MGQPDPFQARHHDVGDPGPVGQVLDAWLQRRGRVGGMQSRDGLGGLGERFSDGDRSLTCLVLVSALSLPHQPGCRGGHEQQHEGHYQDEHLPRDAVQAPQWTPTPLR